MQILINGLVSGSVIALLAVAFQSVFLPTRVFFIGLAGIYVTAPFIAYSSRHAGHPWPVSILLALAVSVSMAVVFEWANHARLSRRHAGEAVHLVSSLGLYLAVVQGVILIWGGDPRTLRANLDVVFEYGGLTITLAQLVALTVAVAALGIFGFFLQRSEIGMRLRALSDSPIQFALFGYNVGVYRYFVFAISGALAAVASLVNAYDVGFDPNMGLQAVLLAVVAVIVGGRSSFLGPILGGLILGTLRAQVAWHFSANWSDAATFALLACFLIFRSRG